jgi:hypothetical protein
MGRARRWLVTKGYYEGFGMPRGLVTMCSAWMAFLVHGCIRVWVMVVCIASCLGSSLILLHYFHYVASHALLASRLYADFIYIVCSKISSPKLHVTPD